MSARRAAVQELVRKGLEVGYLTCDEAKSILRPGNFSAPEVRQIIDLLENENWVLVYKVSPTPEEHVANLRSRFGHDPKFQHVDSAIHVFDELNLED